MWCLKEHEGRCVYILPGCKTSFGKSQSVRIEGDATVSRLHATVLIEPCEESELQNKCVIIDFSKYGTYISRDGQKTRLPEKEKFILQAGDEVQFGLKQSIFTVIHHFFVIVTSNLKKEEADRLRSIVKNFGGKLLDNWHSSCTHLTVSEKSLFTIKLAYALASCKTIVTTLYWDVVTQAVNGMKELPAINDFLPTVKEEWLQKYSPELYLPKEERKTLFCGLSFVHFCAKQYSTYVPLITAAGGKSCVYPTKKPLTPRDLTARNAIVIQQPVNDSSQFTVQAIAVDYPIIHRKLNAIKRRMIVESEMLLAILYCSIEKYCNPNFNFRTLFKSNTQMFSSSGCVIAEDTQDTSSTSNKKQIESKRKQRIIPETIDSQNDSLATSKKARIFTESEKNSTPGNSKSENDITCLFSNEDNKQPRIIPETCESLNKSIPNVSFRRNSIQKPEIISESYDKNASNDSFCGNSIKKPQVIPESCDKSISNDNLSQSSIEKPQVIPESCDKNISNDSFSRSSIKKPQVIPESCDKSSFCVEKERHAKNISWREDVELHQEIILEKKNNSTVEKRKFWFKKDDSLLEGNDTTLKKKNVSFEKNNLENDSAGRNDESESENWQNSRTLRIISIEKVNIGDKGSICVNRMTKKELEKSRPKIKKSQLGQRNKHDEDVKVIDTEKGDEREKENPRKIEVENMKMEEKDVTKEEKPRKIEADWYQKYLGREFTDIILRKDVPRGKRFVKASVPVPKKKLRSDDFL